MKTWLITGASRGLGRATAQAALRAGDQVVATARNVAAIRVSLGTHPRLLLMALDVTNPHTIATVTAQALRTFEHVDILVNNAAYGLLGTFEECSQSAIEKQFATNVFGAMTMTRAVLPTMRHQRSGHVISVSSVNGIIGSDMASIYSATKFALAGWSESLSLELAPFGIHVTVVYPGTFRTDFLDPTYACYAEPSIADYSEANRASTEAVAHQAHHGNPGPYGELLVQLAHMGDPPLHLPVGSDAVDVLLERGQTWAATAHRWKALAASTDN